ncbi:MAG: transposase [Silvibacterium sp.]
MLGMAGPATAQDNGVQHPSARQQIQHIHTRQSIDQELARPTKDMELTPEQQHQVRPLLHEEISDSIRPLLRLGREHILRGQRLDRALISSLERDPLLSERLRRLRTIPGVGPITALTWALEIGDYTRFQ